MNYDLIRIQLEKRISDELFQLFEGKLIEQVIREGKVEKENDTLKSYLEGMDFKITKKLAGNLYFIFEST